jgi:hypothetical protein
VAHRERSLEIARAASVHGELADRALVLVRLLAPIVIEADSAVVAARAAPRTWAGYSVLAAARDRAARAVFDRGANELFRRLLGAERSAAGATGDASSGASSAGPEQRANISRGTEGRADGWIDAPNGWRQRDRDLDPAVAWQAIATQHGVTAAVRIERSDRARPRAFVVEPGREVIVVLPADVDTPAARFAVLHELGHALCAVMSRAPVPRVVDEAVASYVARAMEGSELPPGWSSSLAAEVRRRRRALAAALDAVERGVCAGAAVADTPPWSLWHDPGAQTAYVMAEDIADRLDRAQLADQIAHEHARVDRLPPP